MAALNEDILVQRLNEAMNEATQQVTPLFIDVVMHRVQNYE